jgi:hypothetical protein
VRRTAPVAKGRECEPESQSRIASLASRRIGCTAHEPIRNQSEDSNSYHRCGSDVRTTSTIEEMNSRATPRRWLSSAPAPCTAPARTRPRCRHSAARATERRCRPKPGPPWRETRSLRRSFIQPPRGEATSYPESGSVAIEEPARLAQGVTGDPSRRGAPRPATSARLPPCPSERPSPSSAPATWQRP